MKKRTITVTTGTRAEFGIIRPILKEIHESKKLKLILIVTGSHLSHFHGMSISEIKKEGFQIYKIIKLLPKEDSNYEMAVNVGKTVIEFSKIFKKIKPDINLVLGDRDEMLASTISAYHMNIPQAHIHGGDKSKGGIDEYNRHAITKMSNIHFAATKKSYARIITMGENSKHVFLTGSPSVDQLVKSNISSKTKLEQKIGVKLNGNELILLQHPVTTETELSKKQIHETLKAIAKLGLTTIAIAPNSDAGYKKIYEELYNFSKKHYFFHFFKNLKRSDFLGLLKYGGVLIGNSSSGMIESGYFGIPVINLGIRQDKRERGKNVIDVPNFNSNLIYKALKKTINHKRYPLTSIYGKGNASKKIVHILEKISLDDKLIKKQITY